MADRAVWQRTIVDERGNIIPGAEVTVRSYPGGSLVTLYENPEGAPKSNPFVTGNDGFARFWANSQRVEIVAVGAGSSIRWIVDLLNADEVIGGAVTEATAAAAVAVSEAEAAADRAEAARDAAQLSAGVYEDIAAGLAATSDGDYFSVPSEDDDAYLILYRNDSGSATEIRRYPSAEAVDRITEVVDFAEPDTNNPNEVYFPITDRDGVIVAGVAGDGAFLTDRLRPKSVEIGDAYTSEAESAHFAWGLLNQDGGIQAGMKRDGAFAMAAAEIGSFLAAETKHPRFVVAHVDLDGVIVAGQDRQTGRWVDVGDAQGNVTWLAWVEPHDNACEEAFVTWLSTEEGAVSMEYRRLGGGAWAGEDSIWSRPFPVLDGLWLHTALLKGLEPDTRYQIRVPGSMFMDTFKTPPAEAPKIAIISDFQTFYFGPEAPISKLANSATGRGMDLLLIPGDHVADDGRFHPNWMLRWFRYLLTLTKQYRSPTDDLVPMIGLIGNHEGMNPQGDASANIGGEGTVGPIESIFVWSYWPGHEARYHNSAATFSVGSSVFVVGIETDHTEPLPGAQSNWLINQVAEAYPNYDHILILGHAPAFYASGNNRHFYTRQARQLRNVIYPALSDYADKCLYICGHDHVLALTPPLQVDYDEGLSLEDNDERYYTDPEHGIVQIGTGPVQWTPRSPQQGDAVSAIDGSRMFVAALGITDGAMDARGSGLTNLQGADVHHYWRIEIDGADLTATAIGTHDLPFIVYEKGA